MNFFVLKTKTPAGVNKTIFQKKNFFLYNGRIFLGLQRMRHTALSKGRAPSPELVPGHLLRGGNVLHGRLRRLRAGHLAVTAVHGSHDLHSADCPPDTSTLM